MQEHAVVRPSINIIINICQKVDLSPDIQEVADVVNGGRELLTGLKISCTWSAKFDSPK